MSASERPGRFDRLKLPAGLAVAAAVGLASASACRRAPAASAGAEAEAARLERRLPMLERQIELAAGGDFYLIMDPAGPELTLLLRGAELQRFRVLGLQVGYPRISWFTRRQPQAWQGRIWSGGELVPPREIDRVVINAEERPKGQEEAAPPPIPKTPEELYKVPSSYLVRFAGGLAIEVRPREGDANASRVARFRTWWAAKWRNVASVVSSSDRDAVRIRIILDAKDADSLYRSLPPSVSLLVLMSP